MHQPSMKVVSKVKTVDRWPLWAVDTGCILGTANGLGYRVEGLLIEADDIFFERTKAATRSMHHAYSQIYEIYVCAPNRGIIKSHAFMIKIGARDLGNKIFLRRAPKSVVPVSVVPPVDDNAMQIQAAIDRIREMPATWNEVGFDPVAVREWRIRGINGGTISSNMADTTPSGVWELPPEHDDDDLLDGYSGAAFIRNSSSRLESL